MNGKIKDIETMGSADGPGVRLVVFLAGCKLRCLYCHNPETWKMCDFKREISSEEVLKLYNKYKVYYGEEGGVTFSGGEPLLQSEFVLETTGVADDYDEVLKLVDLVILDVKAVDADEYKQITGRDISDFNKFLEKCQTYGKKLWLRQVVVPSVNDDEAHALKLKEFASSLKNVERIELLPYHSMGKSKYDELGIEYRLGDTPNMDKERCKELEEIINKKA